MTTMIQRNGIRATGSQVDKFHETARDAMLLRHRRGKFPEGRQPVPGAAESPWLGKLIVVGREVLAHCGVPANVVQRLSEGELARLVMLGSIPQGIRMDAGTLSNITSMYSNILVDAANVTLRDSFNEAPTSYKRWMREAEPADDFRDIHRTILGEISDPKAIAESGEFEESTTTDGKESYKLVVWGEIFSVSFQAITNDRLGAFLNTPRKQGRAMARKQNKLAYKELTANAALQNDGIELFHSSHGNLAGSGTVPTTAALNAAHTTMATQSGLNADVDALDIEPRFILAPRALQGTVSQLLASSADPSAANGNSGVANIWEGRLEPIFDAQLDVDDPAAWYLAADSDDVDTVEYSFLSGQEEPVLDSEHQFNRLGVRYRIYQAFGVKAIDYRGLYKNPGA